MATNLAQFPGRVWDGTTPSRPTRQIDANPELEDWDQIVAEMIAVQTRLSEARYFGTTAGGVEIGHALYNASGTLTKAEVDSEAEATVYGLAIDDVTAPTGIEVLREGSKLSLLDWTTITGTALLTPDAVYYVAASGGLTNTPTTTTGKWVAQVGVALDANTLLIQIGTPTENP